MLQCRRRLGSFALPQRLWRGDVLRCVDLHCGGEPATVVVDGGGFDQVQGANMFEKRRDVMARLDHWREGLLHEPRGYPCANADFLVPPTLDEADAAFVVVRVRRAIGPVSRRPRRSSPSRRRCIRSCRATTRSASRLPWSNAACCRRTGGSGSSWRRRAGLCPWRRTWPKTAAAAVSRSRGRRPSSPCATRSWTSETGQGRWAWPRTRSA